MGSRLFVSYQTRSSIFGRQVPKNRLMVSNIPVTVQLTILNKVLKRKNLLHGSLQSYELDRGDTKNALIDLICQTTFEGNPITIRLHRELSQLLEFIDYVTLCAHKEKNHKRASVFFFFLVDQIIQRVFCWFQLCVAHRSIALHL